jgi:hypothetical protein
VTDIIVTLPKDQGGMVHLGEKESAYKFHETPYWKMGRKTKCLNIGDKVFICCEGYIRGYFIVENMMWEGEVADEEAKWQNVDWIIEFVPNSWTWIKPIKRRGLTGYQKMRYKYKVIHTVKCSVCNTTNVYGKDDTYVACQDCQTIIYIKTVLQILKEIDE